MSHVQKRNIGTGKDAHIRDLTALQEAVKRCSPDLEFVRDQKTFQAYYSADKCDHAIRIKPELRRPNNTYDAYEIGLCQEKPGEFSLKYDPYGGSLNQRCGENLDNLAMYYHAEAARRQAKTSGHFYSETPIAGGGLLVNVDIPEEIKATIG